MHAFFQKRDKSASSSSTKPAQKESISAPWVEKYRPRTIEDVVEQADVVSVLRKCMEGRTDFPNLLLYGPPGTGKTSSILAAVREMFGRDLYKQRILELNASDERGIQVIRDKVKQFAQLTVNGIRPDGKPCPPFKIVILDEADSMTQPAQAALRRTMERESKTTRFCLICNYISRIIKPLTSRCMKFRFKPISRECMMERLQYIVGEEKLQCEDSILDSLVTLSGGDMRNAITSLQSCGRLKGVDKPITLEDVYEVTGHVPEQWLDGLLKACNTHNYDNMVTFVSDLLVEAYSSSQLLEQLLAEILKTETMTDKQKSIILDKLGVVSSRISDGASEYIHLLDLCCTMTVALRMEEMEID